MPRLLPVVLLLSAACGPPEPAPTVLSCSATITNNYAVSLFTLTVAPTGQNARAVFDNVRIEAGASADSTIFNIPIAGDEVALDFIGTSLGEQHHLAGTHHMGTGATRLTLIYDFDLATADFTVQIGTGT